MKAFITLPVILLLLSVAACEAPEASDKTLDFVSFQLTTPSGWAKISQKGTDSYIGGLTNGQDTLWFDHGMYGVGFPVDDEAFTHAVEDTVNGIEAFIASTDTPATGIMYMHIVKGRLDDQFTMWGEKIKDSKTAFAIFKSLRFSDSDTLKNPLLTSNRFVKFEQTRRGLYKTTCATCHGITKKLGGPPLNQVIPLRSSSWIYTYLTNRDRIEKDSLQKELLQEYRLSCSQYPEFTQARFDSIYNYILLIMSQQPVY